MAEGLTTAIVMLWGTEIGAVLWDDVQKISAFEYTKEFNMADVELSPIHTPNRPGVFAFPALSERTFKGLPGLLSDSLPDKFGNTLIDQWLVRNGMSIDEFNPVSRLCYIGTRGMGAIEFVPAIGDIESDSPKIDLSEMVALASEILKKRKEHRFLMAAGNDIANEKALSDILHIGTSAGGARAKAVIAWNQETNEVRSGQVKAKPGFGYWLLKFDGVDENSDKELNDPKGFGRIEYAYYLMAKDAGIEMNRCRLFEENGRAHFMTERFDRLEGGEKLHMQSLCALGHYDFNVPGAYGYEQAFSVIRSLKIENPQAALEEQFRRMVFNIVSRNQDDHTKNIAFLMDKRGNWKLSPAFDVCYSYNPTGDWTATHQMAVNGKRDEFSFKDLVTTGEHANLRKTKVKNIVKQVCESVGQWERFAKEAGVAKKDIKRIPKVHRLRWGI